MFVKNATRAEKTKSRFEIPVMNKIKFVRITVKDKINDDCAKHSTSNKGRLRCMA